VIRKSNSIRYFVNNLESLTDAIDKAHKRMSNCLFFIVKALYLGDFVSCDVRCCSGGFLWRRDTNLDSRILREYQSFCLYFSSFNLMSLSMTTADIVFCFHVTVNRLFFLTLGGTALPYSLPPHSSNLGQWNIDRFEVLSTCICYDMVWRLYLNILSFQVYSSPQLKLFDNWRENAVIQDG